MAVYRNRKSTIRAYGEANMEAKMNVTTKTADERSKVEYVTINDDNSGQRIDNFLLSHLKGVPRSYIYRILRKGEVRVNKGRAKAQLKLSIGDTVRIPPLRLPQVEAKPQPRRELISLILDNVLYEDDGLIIINKPTGVAVHGGSGVQLGVVEILRHAFPQLTQLELVHRLDRDTSGCLMLAKRRAALVNVQKQWRDGQVEKKYWALVAGIWPNHRRLIEAPLLKNQLSSGERMVRVHAEGKASTTEFRVLQKLQEATLVEANPITGRTHQIRVHCQFAGHPILGDEKYCDRDVLKTMRERGVKSLCLHSRELNFTAPDSGKQVRVEAPLEEAFQTLLDQWPKE